jgi:hypothetical protein
MSLSPIRALRIAVPLVPFGFLVYGVARVLTAGSDFDDRHKGWAVVFSSAIVWVAFLLLGAAASAPAKEHDLGWVSVVLGADGRLSTSKATVWLWTFGVGYALLFVAGVGIFVNAQEPLFPASWDDYLILLGGPFAAGVLAKFAVVTKFNNGTIGKTVVPGLAQATALGPVAAPPPAPGGPGVATTTSEASVADIVNNDDGALDVVDSQYVLFNLIAFAYAMGVFLSNNFNSDVTVDKYLLPGIPAQLLALVGASAATYVANKSIQKDAPGISSAHPSVDVAAGTSVLLTGVNLVPQGLDPLVAAAQTSVWLTPGTTAAPTGAPVRVVATSATPTAVVFEMPDGLHGLVGIVVVGPGALPTAEYSITAT